MVKDNKTTSSRKLHKYDHIDNNYLEIDERIPESMIWCGIASGISSIAFTILPAGVLMYIISILERTREYINQAGFILISCVAALVGSLAASIFAKVRCRQSKWATANIVYISINLVISGLISWFFVWLMNTYGN